ncbi:MAG: FkbM family methyltransferase [Saprospiraceae bacterium]|nr:FkbM family methyltransferase [Saprospiraceae bacterium]
MHGTRLRAQHGWPVTTGSYYFGLLEFETMAFLGHLLGAGDLLVDVGAHVGSYAILAGARDARVVAVEPHPESRHLLEEHVRMNNLGHQIEILPHALDASPGTTWMTSRQGQQNHVMTAPSTDAMEVATSTLNALCESHPPTAIKIDVEGFELSVLRGGEAVLQHPALLAVCVETMGLARRYGSTDQEVVQMLRDAGFEAIDYAVATRKLMPATNGKSMQIMVRAQDQVQRRLAEAHPIAYRDQRI